MRNSIRRPAVAKAKARVRVMRKTHAMANAWIGSMQCDIKACVKVRRRGLRNSGHSKEDMYASLKNVCSG